MPTRHPSAAAEALTSRVDEAVARARRFGRPVLASVTVPLPGDVDVAAVHLRQPPRRRALVRVGAARPRRVRDRGARRRRAGRCRTHPGSLHAGRADVLRGDARRRARRRAGQSRHRAALGWRIQLLPRRLHRTRVVVLPTCGAHHARAFADAIGRERARDAQRAVPRGRRPAGARRARRRPARRLSTDPLPLVDPDPAGGYEISSVRPPTDFERAVEEGARLVRSGAVEKLVLAREVRVGAARPFNPAAVFGALRCRVSQLLLLLRRERPRRPSSARARSCSCAAPARWSARSPSPDRPAAARTRRSTTTSASASCAARRIARSTASSCARSSARWSRCRCGSRPPRSPAS